MERRLSGKVMPTIYESENSVEVFEAVSKKNLNRAQKALLFVVTQITNKTDKETIIAKLESIKKVGKVLPNYTLSDLIQNCLDELSSSEISKIAQELIDFLNTNNDEII
jgi:hypothetical protein